MSGLIGSAGGGASIGTAKGVRPGGGAGAGGDTEALFVADFEKIFGAGLLSEWGYNPFLDTSTYVVGGANPLARVDTITGGVLGTSGPGTGVVTNKGGTGVAGEFYISDPRSQAWVMGGLVAVAKQPTAATLIYTAALQGAADSVQFLQWGADSINQFEIFCDGTVSGSGSQKQLANSVGTVGQGIQIGDENFYRYIIGFNPAEDYLAAAVNGTLAAFINPGTKMPTQPMAPLLATHGISGLANFQGMFWGYGF